MARDPVEEQPAIQMVELVEEGACLEGVGLDDAFGPVDGEAAHDNRGGPGDVAGEVGHAHAALAGHDRAVGEKDFRVEQHDFSVTRTRLLVAGDVDREGAHTDADLGGGDAHARGRGAHGVDQVRGQRPGRVIDAAHRSGRLLEEVVGEPEDRLDSHVASENVGLGRVEAALDAEVGRQVGEARLEG